MLVKGRVIGGCKFGNKHYLFIKTRKGIVQCEGRFKVREIYNKFLGQKIEFLIKPLYVKQISKKSFKKVMKKTKMLKI